MVKSVQDGVRHNSARTVETMPLALHLRRAMPTAEREDRVPRKSVVGRDCSAAATTTEFVADGPRSTE